MREPMRLAGPRGDCRAVVLGRDDGAAAPVVFAGYGLRVPGEQGFAYDSYAGLDVKDKNRRSSCDTSLRTRTRELKQSLARYAGLRYKAMAARDRGAKALLVVTGPRSANAGELVPLTLDTAAAGSGIAAASVTGEVAAALFAGPARSLEETQQALDSGNPHVAGFELKDVAGLADDPSRAADPDHAQHRRLPAGDAPRRRASRG